MIEVYAVRDQPVGKVPTRTVGLQCLVTCVRTIWRLNIAVQRDSATVNRYQVNYTFNTVMV